VPARSDGEAAASAAAPATAAATSGPSHRSANLLWIALAVFIVASLAIVSLRRTRAANAAVRPAAR
jgi:hypothetical protein